MVKKKKITRTQKKLLLVAKFLAIFNLLSIPLYIAIYADFSFLPLQSFIALVSDSILKIFGYSTALHDNIIIIAAKETLLKVSISWDSTGWKSVYALAALAIATPVATDKKTRFMIFALPAIFVLNIARIVTTISFSLSYGIQYFELLHTLLWREGLIAAVVLIWAFWAYKQKYNIR